MTTSIKYFAGLKEQTEIKSCYKRLVFKHHPDKGGDTATMQEINSQYADVMRGIYQSEGKTEESVDWWMEQEGMIFDVIAKLVNLEGLEVELLGVWIWISGDTKKHKEALGKNGIKARYSPDKKCWYWRSKEHSYRRKNSPDKSLDDLRNTFGSRKAAAQKTKLLA